MAEGIEVGTGYVSLVPSAAGFGAKLQTLIAGEAGQAGQAAGKALSSGITASAGSAAKSVAGVFAAVGAAGFLRGSLREAEDAARIGRLTDAVIKSTGGSAGVTAAQVDKLAQSLSQVAGIDDEVIQSAENVMLTFTQVSGTVFPAAVKAAVDMSAALGTDLQGSVIQLGKALNDPIQGMTALRRVGVSFTEGQKDQVKALQDAGDLLGAQKLILAEVNREFGGAAAAGATATERLHVAVGNLEESLGTALVPAANLAAAALTGVVGGFSALPGPIRATSSALLVFAGASLAVGLLAPKVRAARLELEGFSVAGVKANTALGIFSKAALTLVGIIGAINFADKISGVEGLDKQVAKLAGTTDKDLNKAFHDTNNELRGLHLFESIGLSKRHDEFATFTKVIETGNFALAQRIIASETEVDVRGRLQAAYDKAISQTRELNNDQALSAGIIAGTGDAVEDTAAKVEQAAKAWDDLHGQLEDLVGSDWSQKLGSDLTAALNPMERFVTTSAEKITDLKSSVDSAAADLGDAQKELDKLKGPAITDPVDAFLARGTEATTAQLDTAQAKVDKAAAALTASQKKLAEAQKSPLDAIRDNLTANLSQLTSWLGNITKLSKGGHETLAKDLAALGPDASASVAEAAGASPAQLNQLDRLFAQRDKLIADAASGAFELNVDQAGKPGETLADIIADRYQKSLVPKFVTATQAALNEANDIILGINRPVIPGVTPGIAGPPVPLGPPAPQVPAGAAPTAGTKTVTVNLLSPVAPEPAHLAKAIAWEL